MTVVGEAPLVDTATSSVSGVVEERRITNLPLNERSNVQRPDLVAGRSFESLVQKGNIEEYFDLSGLTLPDAGFYGNLGRNVVLGPGFTSFDFNLKKDIPLGISEGSRLEFRADFFNLFNRANFAIPNFRRVINGRNGNTNASAGKITSTVSTSRQLQFGLKLVF